MRKLSEFLRVATCSQGEDILHEIKISAKEVKSEQCGGGDETVTNCDTRLNN